MNADWGAAIRSGAFRTIEPLRPMSIQDGARQEMKSKIRRHLMLARTEETELLLARLSYDQIAEIFRAVVPAAEQSVSFRG